MGQVFLKKKQQINEDDIAVNDPQLASRMAELNKQLADAENVLSQAQKTFNDTKNRIMQAKAAIQKEDATKSAQNIQNNQQQNNVNAVQNQNTNESADYMLRKAIRLSKKLYEEKKEVASLGRDIKDKLDDLDLSYTMNLQQCKKLARKVEDVLDDNFDKKNSDNKWPVVEREIKKYFKRADEVNFSNTEKGQVLNVIKDILKDKSEYDWVFGNDNEDLKKEIEDSLE